jgi:hypothetical protein
MSGTKLLKQTIGLILVVLLFGCAPTPETPTEPPTEYKYTFDTFPDGKDILGDTTRDGLVWQSLDGDEFSEWGFLVASTPVSNCVAVRMNFCWTTDNYLALLDGVSCSNARRIEITFIEPVREVTLAFNGASTNYVMKVYDENGELLEDPPPVQMAEFNKEGRLVTISFSSDSANIGRISFGAYLEAQAVVVAIREIGYVR